MATRAVEGPGAAVHLMFARRWPPLPLHHACLCPRPPRARHGGRRGQATQAAVEFSEAATQTAEAAGGPEAAAATQPQPTEVFVGTPPRGRAHSQALSESGSSFCHWPGEEPRRTPWPDLPEWPLDCATAVEAPHGEGRQRDQPQGARFSGRRG